ncbi:MAG: VapC toxin family PIN domain ribonuclease [Chlamydiae bacterium]|nr:MAG: VapC toxin family PIN domain ribonuclease [Chlamydiota bacterium]
MLTLVEHLTGTKQMSAKFFIDTNIFVYTFDSTALIKQKKSQKIIAGALESGLGVISYQVVQEFINVATRKFKNPMSVHECRQYVETIMQPLCEIYPTFDLYKKSLETMNDTGYSFYNSLILSASIISHCKTLYSEDLQAGHKISGVTIRNPYK